MEGRETKRKRGEDSNNYENTEIWPRFITISSKETEKPLTKLSPFVIEKAITGMAGAPKSVKKLRSGQILVECEKKAHSTNLLRTTSMAGIAIETKAHAFLNSSKGVIKSKELECCTEDELTQELKNQGVISAYRIKIKRDKKEIATNTIILTFNKPTPPKEIRAGFLNIKIEDYIPNPMRCFNCQKLGHLKKHCKRNAVCPRCGNEGHSLETCSAEMKCVNCEGKHLSFSKTCPRWIEEKDIQKLKAQKNITYQDAKKFILTQKSLISEKNYAGALKTDIKKVKHAETQTPTLPELYYKDQDGTFKKWEINEIICTKENSTQSNIEEMLPGKVNPENISNKNYMKKNMKEINQGKDLKSKGNKTMDILGQACEKDDSITDLKIQKETMSQPLNSETRTQQETDSSTRENDMEIIEENEIENDTISKNSNRKTNKSPHQAQSNIIIKTLQKPNKKK